MNEVQLAPEYLMHFDESGIKIEEKIPFVVVCWKQQPSKVLHSINQLDTVVAILYICRNCVVHMRPYRWSSTVADKAMTYKMSRMQHQVHSPTL